jgi:hypothetical protein
MKKHSNADKLEISDFILKDKIEEIYVTAVKSTTELPIEALRSYNGFE